MLDLAVMRGWSIALLMATTFPCAGCGEDETAIVVHVDLTAYEVNSDVDLLYLELEPIGWGRSQPLEAGESRPAVRIVQGPLTPNSVVVVASVFHGVDHVATSPGQPVEFAAGKTKRVDLVIQP